MSKLTRRGGKIAGSHSTTTDHSVIVVDEAARCPEVTKIVLGIIRNVNGSRRIKFKRIQAGLEVDVHGAGTVQRLYIYTSDPAATESILRKAFER